MFNGCTKLKSISMKNFNTEKVTDMSHMFTLCESLTSLDLSSFNTPVLEGIKEIFSECKSLTYIDVSKLNTKIVQDFSSAFYGVSSTGTIIYNPETFSSNLISQIPSGWEKKEAN